MGTRAHCTMVVADDRERNSEIIKIFSDVDNVSVAIKRLAVGDYIVDHRLIFERKTLNDFARSIVDGRLFRQAIQLASSKYKNVSVMNCPLRT